MADKSLMYEILYGHKPSTSEPKEFKVFRKIAQQMLDLDQPGKSIVRELATIGIKHDLGGYLPYVFFAFHAPGGSRHWPYMPQYLTIALRMGRWVLSASMAVPNYTREVVTPPPQLEANVDQALHDLAAWCWKDLRNDLTIRYLRILKDNMADFGRASNLPDARTKVIVIKGAFEERINLNPAAFPGGDNVPRMIRFFGI